MVGPPQFCAGSGSPGLVPLAGPRARLAGRGDAAARATAMSKVLHGSADVASPIELYTVVDWNRTTVHFT
jgi:hypothetical protein